MVKVPKEAGKGQKIESNRLRNDDGRVRLQSLAIRKCGPDPRAIRDALDDDRIRRCPDREAVPPRR